jgi:hypothetical protein
MKSSLRQTATPQHWSLPRRNDGPRPKTASSGRHPRRRFLSLTAGAAAFPAMSRFAWARVVVPAAPAGGTDITARLIGQWLAERLDQQFIVDNRPRGASDT